MRVIRNWIVALLVVSSLLAWSGCGSATSNDQGVAFTFLGYFVEVPEGGSDELPIGELFQVVPLSFTNPEVQGSQFAGSTNLSGALFSFAGVQNNLSDQFIRTERMFMDYFIPGAQVQPPSDSTAFPGVVGPFVSDEVEGDPFNSSLPDSFAGDNAPGNTFIGGVSVVTAAVMAWINLNRTLLPEPPFDMIVTSRISGVTSAGDRLETNKTDYQIRFTPDNVITPTVETVSGGTTEETT